MQSKTDKGSRADERRRRLAAELRSNLGKRKLQARARSAAERAPVHQGGNNPSERPG